MNKLILNGMLLKYMVGLMIWIHKVARKVPQHLKIMNKYVKTNK